jgi:acylphosphatase
MQVRADIRVTGNLCDSGYRSLVRRAAQSLNLKGYVEADSYDSVRIVCEGDKKAIEELCRRIRIKDGFIEVESVRRRLDRPKGEFKVFEVKVNDPIFEVFMGNVTMQKGFTRLIRAFDRITEGEEK